MSHKEYNHFSYKERQSICYYCFKKGHSVREVACMLGRHPSAIYRELKRNRNHRGQYGALPANRMARARRYNKDTGFVLKNPTILSYVQERVTAWLVPRTNIRQTTSGPPWAKNQPRGNIPVCLPGSEKRKLDMGNHASYQAPQPTCPVSREIQCPHFVLSSG